MYAHKVPRNHWLLRSIRFCCLNSQVADDALEDGARLLLAIRAGIQEQQPHPLKDAQEQPGTGNAAATPTAAGGGAAKGGLAMQAATLWCMAYTCSQGHYKLFGSFWFEHVSPSFM
jgi:hypothetical protein